MVETLTIDHIGHRGDGVTVVNGEFVYVPFSLPGEQVEVDHVAGHSDRRRLLRVDQAASSRITPFCPHFGICGGCAIQHWRETDYLAWKRAIVIEALEQSNIDCEIASVVDAHGQGRRRIVAHARFGGKGSVRVGFAAAQSHDIVAIDHCPILVPELAGALTAAGDIAEILQPVGKPLDLQFTATANGPDVDLRGSGALPIPVSTALARIAERHRLARLTRHGELVALRAQPVIRIGRAEVVLPPGSFLQATHAGELALAERVLASSTGAKVVVDLFCGVGPFALRLAERTRVRAYDSDAASVAALAKAAQTTKGLKPVAVEVRDLFRRPLLARELRDADAVIFDPPRQGAHAQARELAASKVPVIVAVSCNPATFARDARFLIDSGYKIGVVEPIDQFRHTAHVELVARFTR